MPFQVHGDEFQKGDRVILSLQGSDVATGTIFSLDPNSMCQGIMIGEGRASVHVEKVVTPGKELPFPSNWIETIDEALGSFTIWKLRDIQKHTEHSQNVLVTSNQSLPSNAPRSTIQWESHAYSSTIQWESHAYRSTTVNECIDFAEFHTSLDKMGPQDNFPPMRNSKRHHHDISEKILQSSCLKNTKRKRICEKTDVALLSTIDCCTHRCCQMARRDAVKEVREQYWGQNISSRHTYVFDAMSMAPRGLKNFMFFGEQVCEKAWYTIHGISRASYYRYKAEWLDGCVDGFHGNRNLNRQSKRVMAAKQALWEFVETTADRMPHKCRTSKSGTREAQYIVPSIYKHKDMLREVNESLRLCNEKGVSQSTFSRMWNVEFKEVQIAKNNGFSKCDFCTSIKMKLMSTKVQSEKAKYIQQRDFHNSLQRRCRMEYYTYRNLSCTRPDEYLCIIHDKMDQKKTSLPRLYPEPKATSNAFSLPISLTGMLTHGHEPKAFGHFGLALWKGDSNFTVGSLAKCLRDLETFNLSAYKEHDNSIKDTKSIFGALLNTEANEGVKNLVPNPKITFRDHEASHQTAIPNASTFKCLPKRLFLQMDNSGKDNKNRWLFSYLSLLVAKGIFEEIILNFLMVGHTHEDIDALFGKLSDDLRKSSVYTLPQLMEIFKYCEQKQMPPSSLIQEVPDFKDFVEGYIPNGAGELIGHSRPLQFRFSLSNSFPIMHYKMHPQDLEWLPPNGIEMWKRNVDGSPKLPDGDPRPVSSSFVKDVELVVDGIKKFTNYWKKFQNVHNQHESTFSKSIGPVVEYWEKVADALKQPVHGSTTLTTSFWPSSRWKCTTQLETSHTSYDNNDKMPHYCGPKSSRPHEEFQPLVHVEKGMCLLIRPEDENTYPVWMGVAMSDIIRDQNDINYMKVLVQYWEPISKKKRTPMEHYKDCWEKRWHPNLTDPIVWESCLSIIYSWNLGGNVDTVKSIKIPSIAKIAAQENLNLRQP